MNILYIDKYHCISAIVYNVYKKLSLLTAKLLRCLDYINIYVYRNILINVNA